MLARVGIVCFLLLAAMWAPSCSGTPMPPAVVRNTSSPASGFSSERAWEHLTTLVAIGPRVTGSEESVMARAYILDQLSKLDLRVEIHAATVPIQAGGDVGLSVENLIAVIPGASEDLIILATPYDSPAVEDPDYVGANEGASGAAMLLELARVIAEKPLPYTTWIVFFDGEALFETGDPARPTIGLLGSRAFASSLEEHELLRRVRLAVVFARVGGADLRIARDVRSHRMYREEFFAAAKITGDTDAFRSHQPFESPYASHQSFLDTGMRRVVVLSNSSLASEDESGALRIDPADTLENCSPESLQAVGNVTLMALDRITKRLAKIDRFSENPFEDSDVALEVPVGSRLPVESEIEAVPDASEDADSMPGGAAVQAPEEPAVEDSPDAATQSRREAQDPGPPSRSLGASDLW
jgi:glutaminyl-peptide cyclotransferase